MRAPLEATARAIVRICSSDSTEQGPAMTTTSVSPIVTSPTRTAVDSGWSVLETSA
jgi:hypothetical protein